MMAHVPTPSRCPRAASPGLRLGAMLLAAHLTGAALAQTTPAVTAQPTTPLPLVSVGDELKWNQTTETYTLHVTAAQAATPVELEVFSPGLNINDYANGRAETGYYGDELYGRNEPFETTFTLTGSSGPILERRYAATREHAWESLIATPLPPGTYTLQVTSRGNGKNAYALRTAGGFALEASDFTVNARGKPGEALLAARLNVPEDWIGRSVDLISFDGDGPAEISLQLNLPGGKTVPLTVSGDNAAATDRFQITPELVGEWTVTASVPAKPRQYSNAFTVKVRVDGQATAARLPGFTPPPGLPRGRLLVEVVDTQGNVIPGATYAAGMDGTVRPRLPRGYRPDSAAVVDGAGQVLSPAEVRLRPGGGKVRFVARGMEGNVTVDAVAVLGETRVPLPNVSAEVQGRTVALPATFSAPVGELKVTPAPLPGATAQPLTVIVGDGATTKVTVEYLVNVRLSVQTSPDTVNACDIAQITASARSDFPYRLPARLRLNLPTGWSTDYPLELRSDLTSGLPLRLKVPVRVCKADAAEAVLEPAGLSALGSARVRNPSGTNVTRVGADARVTLTKSAEVIPGGYAMALILTVDRPVDGLKITDPLPQGGNSAAVRSPVNLQGPSLANVIPQATGDVIDLGRVTPGQYTLTYTLGTDLLPERIMTQPDVDW